MVLRVASGPTADVAYLLLAAYALTGRAPALRALAMSWLFSMLSPALAPDAAYATVGRYMVLGGAAFSMLLHGGLFKSSPRNGGSVLATILLGLFFVFHSVVFSPMVDVSVLKAVSWTVAMAAILSAWTGLDPVERQQMTTEFFWFLVLLLLVSLPFIVLPVGFLRNGTGFQGVLSHPQNFGPTMAILACWLIASLVGTRRPSWRAVALLGLCGFAMLASEARTAGLAALLALVISVLLAVMLTRAPIGQVLPGLRSPRLWGVLLAAILAGLVLAPVIAGTVTNYISKSGRADVANIFDAFDASRGRLVNDMLYNIAEHPWAGIGFGIASEPEAMQVSRDPVLGLPTGAAIEKGVMPLAIVEEVGVVGALFVALWLFALLRQVSRSGLAPMAVATTVLLLNFGEATLFSPGGFGLLALLLLGWAATGGRAAGRTVALG